MLPKLQRTSHSAVDPHGSSTTSLVLWDTHRPSRPVTAVESTRSDDQFENRDYSIVMYVGV